MNKKTKLILFLSGSALFFYLIKRVGFAEVVGILGNVRWSWILAGVILYAILIFLRSFKWFILAINIKNDVKYRRFAPFYLVNSLMGNLTPFKSGEAATPFLLKKYLGIELGQGFFVVILDRFFELAIFSLFLIFSLIYVLGKGIANTFIFPIFWAMMAILLAALVFLIIALVSREAFVKMLKFFRIFNRIEKNLAAFYNAWRFFKNKKVYWPLALLTAVGWILEVLSYWLIFNSVFPVSLFDAMTAQMIAAAATFLSFVPGGVGVGEIGAVYVLNLFKYPAVLATSGVIVARVFLTGILIIAGLAGLVVLRHSAAKAKGNSENRS